MTKVAFIGLGSMGGPQAQLIARAGFDLAVYDPYAPALQRFEGKARLATSPRDAATGADIVGLCVRDDQQVLDVLFGENGAADALAPGALVLIHSTVSVATVHSLAERLGEKGIAVADAPVSRTRTTDDQPFVFSMLGGEAGNVERARPIVDAFSTEVEHMGPLGAGMATKIANNLVTWVHIVVAVQAANLAANSGVAVEKLVGLMQSNGNLTPPSKAVIGAKFLTPEKLDRELFVSQGGIGQKDLKLALESAAAAGLDVRMIAQAQQIVSGIMAEPPVAAPNSSPSK